MLTIFFFVPGTCLCVVRTFSVAKKAKARTIIVKLLSTAGTGFFYTTRRPRTTAKLSFMKFDPRANQNVLFNEAKINRPN